ncbi:MAG: hypothetical protein E7168_01290 [Firmicutes bacterium]|nr:hypothetical protein [Bacillota bacterium]
MKKCFKIILVSVFIITLLFVIDFVCIFKFNRPLFAVKENEGSLYRGLFYDTYNCQEYSVPQIKAKGSKFTCVVFDIMDDDGKT